MNEPENRPASVNLLRLLFVTILLLSAFITAKSFIAVNNTKQWADEVRGWLAADLQTSPEQRTPISKYEQRFDLIQQQWAVLRAVSIGLLVLSTAGIFFASKSGAIPTSGRFSSYALFAITLGVLMNVVLWFAILRLGKSGGSLDTHYVSQFSAIAACVGAIVAAVLLLRYGNDWQKVFGASFLVLPGWVLLQLAISRIP